MDIQFKRHRRLRQNATMRSLVRENFIRLEDFIYPIFVIEGNNIKNEISSMPGIYQFSLDRLSEEMDEVASLGIKSVLLFGIPAQKDECGTGAFHDHGIVQEATRFIKKNYPEILVVADTCLCEYTSHGHCGMIEGDQVLNDPSLKVLTDSSCEPSESRCRYYCSL